MALDTANITARIFEQTGEPIENAEVIVALTATDHTPEGTIAPAPQTFFTDAAGIAVMPLVPNTEGLNGTQYRVTAYHPVTRKKIYDSVLFTVPAQDNFLDELLFDAYGGTTPILLVSGNNLPYINLTLTDPETSSPIDLTDEEVIVRVHLRARGGDTVLATIVCEKVTPAAGKVRFSFPNDTLDVPHGLYEGEVEVEFDTQTQTVYDVLHFKVRAPFA